MVIDGGWHLPISPNGFPMPDPERWPSASGGKGFKPLADWTHSLGLKFGESHSTVTQHSHTAQSQHSHSLSLKLTARGKADSDWKTRMFFWVGLGWG